ncbi:hypothetical protein B484DRAFT_470130 [Ochromonadaceae sp. CCMP2298]|nr:hypothetical protein B484DRAFT_470130 [Ochromonadaceae sp. CCMP2298]
MLPLHKILGLSGTNAARTRRRQTQADVADEAVDAGVGDLLEEGLSALGLDDDEGALALAREQLLAVGSLAQGDVDEALEAAAQEAILAAEAGPQDDLEAWCKSFIDARTARTAADPPDLTSEALDKINQQLLCKEGPNGSAAAKLRQLERLRRFDWLYRQGVLRRSMLAYYLHETRATRTRMQGYLHPTDAFPAAIRLPTRLGKLPPGYKMLADRGFYHNSIYYPNLNGVICPHFLQGRSQFSSGEIQADIPLCRLRYTSEVGFALFALEEGAADEISYHKFRIVHHIVHWAYSNINLHQPLRKPPTYDTFPCKDESFDELEYTVKF